MLLRFLSTVPLVAFAFLAVHPGPEGVVVESVEEGSVGAQTGIEVGDILVRWQRAETSGVDKEPTGGLLKHPFDLWETELEQAPRGVVTLFWLRDGVLGSAILPPGEWGLRARPQLSTQDLATYSRGRELQQEEDEEAFGRGQELWASLIERWGGPAPLVASWLSFEKATAEHARGLEAEAEDSFRRAVRAARVGGSAEAIAELQRRWANGLDDGRSFDRVAELYRESLETLRAVAGPGTLREASTLTDLALSTRRHGQLAEAEVLDGRAIAIQEELAPNSLELARSLNSLGNTKTEQGDLQRAEGLYGEALRIRQSLAPTSLGKGIVLNNLGTISWARGDFAGAEALYRQALDIYESHDPGGLRVAVSLNNLGVLAQQRGDLAAAEGLLRRALAIREKLAPGSPRVASTLNNLGIVAEARGDEEEAEAFYRDSLRIKSALSPESADVARTLTNLGVLAVAQGRLEEARELYQRALDIEEKVAPGSNRSATMMNNLGSVAEKRGDLVAAEELYRGALAIHEMRARGSFETSRTLDNLGRLALQQADLASAEALLRRALAIRRRIAPGTYAEAATLYRLGTVLRRAERPEEAIAYFLEALDALESQSSRLGGANELRGRFLAQFGRYYHDALDLAVEQEEPALAFHVFERSRARGLLGLMSERVLLFGRELSPDLRRQRQEANSAYDKALFELSRWSPTEAGTEGGSDGLHQRLEEARSRQLDVEAKVRAASPRLAALQYPRPLSLPEARESLDPGLLLLAYAIGEESSHLFVVGEGGTLSVLPLAADAVSLRAAVKRFRDLWKPGDTRGEWARAQGKSLGEVLLAPARRWIAQAERLLVVPDGPLHYLPFAALQDPTTAKPRYLAETMPVTVVASTTLFAELKRERGQKRPPRVVAFADPAYPPAPAGGDLAEPVLRNILRGGFRLPPLPGARDEVAALRELYREAATAYVGSEAREETVKAVGEEVSVLHFACHGVVNDRLPLSSALALTIPESWREGQDNGFLEAWEIFEQLRIDAELVTLSGCQTALGEESGGEGLLGLTRAFHFAGARSVLASLWAVSDESTAELMRRFYGYLRTGAAKDEALRRAQVDLLRGPVEIRGEGGEVAQRDYRHPFYWAPFQLIGDWQ